MAISITLKSLNDAMKRANREDTLRRLGTADFTMGIKVGKRCYAITFSGFECENVLEATEDDLRDLDFFIEMKKGEWEEFLASQGSDMPMALNELDLNRSVVKSLDARRKLNFTRYHRSIDYFFRCVAA